jgi:hypothetical protein
MDDANIGQKTEVEQLCSQIKAYENEAIKLDIGVKQYEFRILCQNQFIKNQKDQNAQIGYVKNNSKCTIQGARVLANKAAKELKQIQESIQMVKRPIDKFFEEFLEKRNGR